MVVEYQKILIENLSWNEKNAEGIDQVNISDKEASINKTFPKSYEEFLELAGKRFPFTRNTMEFEKLDYMQEQLQSELKKYNLLLKKDCWVFAMYDGEQFLFFYWDEGDDPPVYLCMPCYVQDGADLIEKNAESFSAYVNRSIQHYKSGDF